MYLISAEAVLRLTKAAQHTDEVYPMPLPLHAQAHPSGTSQKTLSQTEAENEKKRNDMRLALARRMRIDLIQSEEEKMYHTQQDRYLSLDKKLKEVS